MQAFRRGAVLRNLGEHGCPEDRASAAVVRQELGQHFLGRDERRPFERKIKGGNGIVIRIVGIEQSDPIERIRENRLH